MDFEDFLQSLASETPSQNLPVVLQALWYEKNNKWQQAHDIVHDERTADCALVHAYLHRKEGDEWNARYWYKRAGKKPFQGSFEAEWDEMVETFLEEVPQAPDSSRKSVPKHQLHQDS